MFRRASRHRGPVVAIIPARIGSTRLPEKALADLGGEPLIWRTCRRARAMACLDEVVVATDDARIFEAVVSRGGRAVRVDEPCASGTERVARAVARLEATFDFVVNLQGDEPFVTEAAVSEVVDGLRSGQLITTLAAPLPASALEDPAAVKVVSDNFGRALYFSRAPIPGRLHVGVYGFARTTLEAVVTLPRGSLCQAEDLEQLGWLEAGHVIHVRDAEQASLSIDTAADLLAAQALLVEQLTESP